MRSLVLVCLLGLALAERIRYDGYKVLTVFPTNEVQMQMLSGFEEMDDMNIDFWSEPNAVGPQDIMVAPGSLPNFQGLLQDYNMTYHVSIENLQEYIDIEEIENEQLRKQAIEEAGPEGVPNVLGRYARTAEINAWLDSLVTKYPTLCKTSSIGKSYEGRDTKMLTVSSGGSKPIIFIDGTTHAREWICGGVITQLINNLLTTAEGKALLERYDFRFVPVVNPDGYEYTFSRDRMWRKTRSPNAGSTCRGTDCNRNFDHAWGQVGASRNPCSQTYMGNRVFSEIESRNLRDAVLAVSSRLALYMNMHSFSQMWLTPYGDTTVRPPHGLENDRVAKLACAAMQSRHGRRYRYGTSWQLLYRVSGACMDWAMSKGKAKYSTVIELRPASSGEGGFIIPPSHIVPNGQEMWAGLVVTGREMKYP